MWRISSTSGASGRGGRAIRCRSGRYSPLGAEQSQLLSRLPRFRRRRIVVHHFLKREPRLALVAHLEKREADLEERGRGAIALGVVLPHLVELEDRLRVVAERVVGLADPIVRVAG